MSDDNWWLDDPAADYSQANDKLFKDRFRAQSLANAALEQQQRSSQQRSAPQSQSSPPVLRPSLSNQQQQFIGVTAERDRSISDASALPPAAGGSAFLVPQLSSMTNGIRPVPIQTMPPAASPQQGRPKRVVVFGAPCADEGDEPPMSLVSAPSLPQQGGRRPEISLRPGESFSLICALHGALAPNDPTYPFAIPTALPPPTQIIFDRLRPDLQHLNTKPSSRRIRLKDDDDDNEQKWTGSVAGPAMLRPSDRPVPLLIDNVEQERRAQAQLQRGMAMVSTAIEGNATEGDRGHFADLGKQLRKELSPKQLESVMSTIEDARGRGHSLLFPPPRVLESRQSNGLTSQLLATFQNTAPPESAPYIHLGPAHHNLSAQRTAFTAAAQLLAEPLSASRAANGTMSLLPEPHYPQHLQHTPPPLESTQYPPPPLPFAGSVAAVASRMSDDPSHPALAAPPINAPPAFASVNLDAVLPPMDAPAGAILPLGVAASSIAAAAPTYPHHRAAPPFAVAAEAPNGEERFTFTKTELLLFVQQALANERRREAVALRNEEVPPATSPADGAMHGMAEAPQSLSTQTAVAVPVNAGNSHAVHGASSVDVEVDARRAAAIARIKGRHEAAINLPTITATAAPQTAVTAIAPVPATQEELRQHAVERLRQLSSHYTNGPALSVSCQDFVMPSPSPRAPSTQLY